MTGEYDAESKTVCWMLAGKGLDGTSFEQKTTIADVSPDERFLSLSVPTEKPGEFVKFMEIRYARRK